MILLTSRGERLPQEQMDAHGLAACELKPLHHEKLRATLARVMANAKPMAASTEAPEPPAAVEPAAPAAPPVTILVAEDNVVNQKVTLLQLRNLGYAADLAVNGREALEAVQRKPYALILMDAQMPEMDGIEATRRIRAAMAAGDPRFPRELKIIAMTANAMSGDREMCLNAGMDDYMAKPVKPESLRVVLNRYLAKEPASPESEAPFAVAQ
jgi:CheY-like chemotaxis protein